jgi:hypothetical protein
VAAPGTAARPGDPGSARQRSCQRRITAPRVTVERWRLPDCGPRRTRPGARIPARAWSARPGLPAGPVLGVERACAPRGKCRRAPRTGCRVRPRDIRSRVLAASRERPVGRRHGHPDLGSARRRPTGGRVDHGSRRGPGRFRARRRRAPRDRRRPPDRAKRILRPDRRTRDCTGTRRTGTRRTGTRRTGACGCGARGRGQTRHTAGLPGPAGLRAPREHWVPG